MRNWRRALVAVLLAACVDGPGGPGHFGEVRVEPGYQPGFEPSVIGVTLDTASVRVSRNSGVAVVDTVLPYTGGELAWIVDLEAEEESLLVAVELRGAGGPLYRGDSVVIVPAGTVGGARATLAVDYVGPALVASVTVSPSAATLDRIGATIQFTAAAIDPDGQVITGQTFAWSSSDPAVATVNPATGFVTAAGNGTATITAAAGGKSGTATIAVAVSPGNPVASVEIQPASASLHAVGATQAFSATAFDAGGVPVTGVTFDWSSSVPAVATIDPLTGVAVAAAHGSTVITATTAGVSGTAVLAVDLAPTVATVTISPLSATLLALGATQQFTAVVEDGSGNPVPGVPVTWKSSNGAVAAIDPVSGVAMATGHGSTVITAMAGSTSGTAVVDVDLVPSVVTITVNPPTATLTALGATQQFSAVVEDGNGTPLHGVPLIWTSSAPGIVTVDPVTGLATAVGNGSATMTASAGNASGTALVVVNQTAFTVTVRPDSATLIGLSKVVEFVAEAWDENGQRITGVAFSWTSSDPAVAIVEPSGRTVPQGLGTAIITATTGGISGTAVVVVLPAQPVPGGP